MPSTTRSSPVATMESVGAMSVTVPVEVVWPRPEPTWPSRPARQHRAVHVARAPRHRGARVDVLGDRVLHEPFGRDDRAAAGVHVLLGGDALDATEVVGVAVGVDDARDRPVASVGAVERERGGRGLHGDQRVDDHDARVALEERDVREVQAAHLVDAGHDLEQAVDGGQLRLAPQAGVDRGRARAVQEPVRLVVPDDAAVRGLDDARVQPPDEAAVRVLVVLGVTEGKGRAERRVRGGHGGRRGRGGHQGSPPGLVAGALA